MVSKRNKDKFFGNLSEFQENKQRMIKLTLNYRNSKQ